MANPQRENGHIDIANDIGEALARIRISGEENQCLWVIFRKTYGWQKKEDWISLSQFSLMTGLKKPNVIRALKKLLSKKIIVINNDNKGNKMYRFNKDFDNWKPLSKKIIVINNDNPVIKKDNKSLSKKITTIDNSTKKIITKEKEIWILPDFVNKKSWEEFEDHRKEIKKTLSDLSRTKNINVLKKYSQEEQKQIIDKTIANRWVGLFSLQNKEKNDGAGSKPNRFTGLDKKNYREGVF